MKYEYKVKNTLGNFIIADYIRYIKSSWVAYLIRLSLIFMGLFMFYIADGFLDWTLGVFYIHYAMFHWVLSGLIRYFMFKTRVGDEFTVYNLSREGILIENSKMKYLIKVSSINQIKFYGIYALIWINNRKTKLVVLDQGGELKNLKLEIEKDEVWEKLIPEK